MLHKAHLTSHSRMSGSGWMITPWWLSRSLRSFLYRSSVCSCHLFLMSSASIRSIPFLSFIVPIFARNILLVSLIFLKRSLVFHILLFFSLSLFFFFFALITEKRLSHLSLLFFGTLHSNGNMYVSFSPLSLASLLSSTICKASSDKHFAFLHLFFLGMVLITISCTISRTSIHSSSGTPSIRSNPLNLFVPSTV